MSRRKMSVWPSWLPVMLTLKPVEGPEFEDFTIWEVYEDRTGAIWLGLLTGEIVRCGAPNGLAVTDPHAWTDTLDVLRRG